MAKNVFIIKPEVKSAAKLIEKIKEVAAKAQDNEKSIPQSAIETILYLSQHSRDPTLHHISSLLYLADRMHLARFGRLIHEDGYVAMKHGPVPSGVDDITEYMQTKGVAQFLETKDAVAPSDYRVKPLREPDLDWLSDSDIDCLDESLKRFDGLNVEQMIEISCSTAAWQQTDLNKPIGMQALAKDVDAAFGLSGTLIQHITNPSN